MEESVTLTCPIWCNIPSIDLYMDQVLILINGALAPIIPDNNKIITATMVNNYVKQKLVSPTEKKKYGRRQITELIMVTLFKLVLSSAEISLVLNELKTVYKTPEQIYDVFLNALSSALNVHDVIGIDLIPDMSSAAIKSLAGKILFLQFSARSADIS